MGRPRYAAAMSGYVASARIVRSTPRLARPGSTDVWRHGGSEPSSPGASQLVDTVSGEPIGPAASDESRLAAIRERWSQLTFFLFDANAWRS